MDIAAATVERKKKGKHVLNRLNPKKIDALSTPGRYNDGGGLYLQVRDRARKSWIFRYPGEMKVSKDGKPYLAVREMGLGPYPDVPLATSIRSDGKVMLGARDLAADARRLVRSGFDPIDARTQAADQERLKAANSRTFEQCAEEYIAAHAEGWKQGSKSEARWRATLQQYAYPVFKGKAISAINVHDVLEVLQPIWATKTETATRLRSRIELVLDAAGTKGYREKGNNPAMWKGNLKNLLARPSKVAKVQHHRALPYEDMPALMKKLRELSGIASLCTQWLTFTCTRTTEATDTEWSEIDMDKAEWTVPGVRMKGGEPHRVPLSPAAMDVLHAARAWADSKGRKTRYVFPGLKKKADQPLSNGACTKALKDIEFIDATTTHGLRSTFRDWAAETTNFPNHVVEMALAHKIPNAVEAAYRRGDLFVKRRKLMETWATYCMTQGKKAGTITSIHAAKKA